MSTDKKGALWTKEDIAFVRANYQTMPYAQIAEAIGRTRKGIVKLLTKLQLKRHPNHRWTNKDKVYLRASYGKVPSHIVAKHLGIKLSVHHQAAQRFGVASYEPRPYTIGEIEFIAENFDTLPHKEIAARINRTLASVECLARREGIKRRTRMHRPYTQAEHDYIVKNYMKMKLKKIGKKLGRTECSIARHMHVHRLIKQPKRKAALLHDQQPKEVPLSNIPVTKE